MSAEVESIAYRDDGGMPWHGLGVAVSNDMTVDEMLVAAKLNWTVSKRPLYFPKLVAAGERSQLRIVPDEYALVRDNDESVLDTVGSGFKPVQNQEVFEFFRRFVQAGDMQMETAGSLKGGKFVWALARINESFTIGKNDETRGYLLLSQPHQFGFSLTAALTPVRVVCWNTINAALGSKLDGSSGNNSASFRMVHSRLFDTNVKAEAERALGLASEGMKAFSHTAEMLSEARAKDDDVTDYFHEVLRLEKPEDDTEEAKVETAENENRNVVRFRQALVSAPGQNMDTSRGTWWGSYNAVSYCVDHEFGRNADNRLYNAWYGQHALTKRRALNLAADYAKAA